DAALQVEGLGVAVFAEERHRLRAPATDLAVDDELAFGVELLGALRDFAEWDDDRVGDAADLHFVRLAHVDNLEIVPASDAPLQFFSRDFRNPPWAHLPPSSR